LFGPSIDNHGFFLSSFSVEVYVLRSFVGICVSAGGWVVGWVGFGSTGKNEMVPTKRTHIFKKIVGDRLAGEEEDGDIRKNQLAEKKRKKKVVSEFPLSPFPAGFQLEMWERGGV